MSALDLFQLAGANQDELPKRVSDRLSVLTEQQRERTEAFGSLVKSRGAVSINMQGWKFEAFLDRGQYLSVQEVAAEEAARTGKTAEQILRAWQKQYYERRMAFESYFENGRRFLYGAPNIGGIGLVYYGIFALILSERAMQNLKLAHLPGNSLEVYVDAGRSTVEEAQIRRDVAPPSELHSMAMLKHADEAHQTAEALWPSMLCSNANYSESIFVGDVEPSSLREVRIEKKEMKRLADLLFAQMSGSLSPSDEPELANFKACMQKMGNHGLRSRLVEV